MVTKLLGLPNVDEGSISMFPKSINFGSLSTKASADKFRMFGGGQDFLGIGTGKWVGEEV